MITSAQVIFAVVIAVFGINGVESLFKRLNYQVSLGTNATYSLYSEPYRRNSQTRVAFVGQPGDRLSLVCNINFSKCKHRHGVRRSHRNHRHRTCRPGGCSEDYFYVGYSLNRRIRGFKYYCGKKTIRKKSRLRRRRPVLVIGKSLIEIIRNRTIK